MRVKVNFDDNDLWCCFSKERIEIGEKYIEIIEKDSSGKYIKTYKLEYSPAENEDEEPFISPN